ncbi:MAG: hypothetical protein U1A78_25465 [Polyangia bacterium]
MTAYTSRSAHAGLALALLVSVAGGCGPADPAAVAEVADPQVGAVASALVLPKVTPIDTVAIPAALLTRPLTAVIRSAADASTLLGSVPPGVDFTKEFLVFFAGGAQPTLGYKTSLTFDNIYVDRKIVAGEYVFSLVVSAATVLDPPGTGCALELPGTGLPFTLVRVDATGLRDYSKVQSHRLSTRHTTIERTCRIPGPACDGTLTAAGLDAIKARPKTGGSVPLYTTGSSYAKNYLGQYTIERWKEECAGGSCSWRKLVPVGGPSYLDRGSVYFYSGGGDSRLVIWSSQGSDTFYSGGGRTYPCWLWGESLYNNIDRTSGQGLVSGVSIRDNMVCSVASGANYHDKKVNLEGFEGAMGDSCVRLTSQSGRPGIDQTLQILTASW